jgi:RNA polymerase sigma factor (sigma-70 family)
MTEEGRRDRTLADRALAGDPAAQEELASRLVCTLRCLAGLNADRGWPMRSDELKELNAVVQALVWKRLPSYEGRCRLETWAVGFCHWEFKRALVQRTAKRMEPLDEHGLEAAAPVEPSSPEDELAPYMRHLSPMQRQVVFAHVVHDQQLVEIAASLGITAVTAGTHFQRALEKLRDVFGSSVKHA